LSEKKPLNMNRVNAKTNFQKDRRDFGLSRGARKAHIRSDL
jgi:hypothetical protein